MEVKHEVVADLGAGLEIWKVNVEDLKEQDLNARYMKADMFERLTENIRADGRLESLPFCALTEKGLEIVSGHHRVRAARQAQIFEIFCIVDITGMSRDRIKSKQLSHNSIDGYDNAELVKRIYDSIGDAKARLEAFVPEELVEQFKRVSVGDVNVEMDIQQVQLMFFKYEQHCIKKLEKYLDENDEAFAAELKQFENVKKTTLLTPEQAQRIEEALKKKDKEESQIEYLIRKLES